MTTYSTDPALYIFTSLTAGSSHIVTATSRLETILRANRVPFKAVDIAVDEKARMLWGRRAGKDASGRTRKLPGLVQEGLVLGDLTEIEDWNEYGELKQHVKIYYDEHTIPNIHNKPPEPKKTQKPAAKPAAKPAVPSDHPVASKAAPAAPAAPPLPDPKPSSSSTTTTKTGGKPPEAGKQTTLPMRSVADEAAQKAKEIRLKSLREKVHGKATDGNAEPQSSSKTAAANPDTPRVEEEAPAQKSKPAGLQSSTTATREDKSRQDFVPETVQSPTTGKWRPESLAGATSHVCAEPVDASAGTDVAKEDKTVKEPKVPAGNAGAKTEDAPESDGGPNNDSDKDTNTEPPKTEDSKQGVGIATDKTGDTEAE
ncbi:hypothetical protein E4U53_005799 [Claviceps sorghi]|nr:hypothetical protein E4U53_005799 [Claviceps sorghi]